jgi:hypothetical protein
MAIPRNMIRSRRSTKKVAAAVSAAAPEPKPALAPAKKPAKKPVVTPEQRYRLIEESAYLRAEKDGFCKDPKMYWLAAEKEIDAKIAAQ